MKPTSNRLRIIGPGALILFLMLITPDARGQSVGGIVPDPIPAQDELSDAYRDLAASRAGYLDALERVEAARRRQALRPPFASPWPAGPRDPIAEHEAYRGRSSLAGPRPYVLRPVPNPYGGPFGYDPRTYGGITPYGYGIGPPGGIDVPFGFGLGGLSIRW